MLKAADRIVDANLNRVREGLRVAEELGRLVLEDRGLQRSLKAVRHALVGLEQRTFGPGLILSRNVARDPGVRTQVPGAGRRVSYAELARANFRRAQEGLRVIEEVCKLEGRQGSAAFQALRFKLYGLEQKMTRLLDASPHRLRSAGKRAQP
jgi:thiamine-phosphate pyrophosphorylase